MLALGPNGVRSAEDHDAFLRVREDVPILACCAPFLSYRLLAVSFFWPAGMSQEMFKKLAVLVEVFNGVGVVGAWAIHELVEVVRQALLGLLARTISYCDQRGVGLLALIPLVLLAPLCGGALILVRALGLAFVLAIEDCSDRLLAGGMVHGAVEQVMGGMGL